VEGWLFLGTRRGIANRTIASGVGIWLLGESLDDGGRILWDRKIVRASPSLGFCLITDGYPIKRGGLGAESRGVENEYLEKSTMGGHIRRFSS